MMIGRTAISGFPLGSFNFFCCFSHSDFGSRRRCVRETISFGNSQSVPMTKVLKESRQSTRTMKSREERDAMRTAGGMGPRTRHLRILTTNRYVLADPRRHEKMKQQQGGPLGSRRRLLGSLHPPRAEEGARGRHDHTVVKDGS